VSITLICISFQDRAPRVSQEISLDRHGGTIGRASDNDFVVEDPDRFASGHHCRIFYDERGYCVEDTSSNGTLINYEEELFRGQTHILQTGDVLTVGDCVIEVEVQPEQTAQPSRPTPQPRSRRPDPMADQSTKQADISIDEAFSFTTRKEPIPDQISESHRPMAVSPNKDSTSESPIPAKKKRAAPKRGRAAPKKTRAKKAAPARPRKRAASKRKSASTSRPRETQARQEEAPAVNRDEADQISLAFFSFLSELDMEPQQLAGQDLVEFMQMAGIILRILTDGMMEILKARNAVKKSFKMDTTKIKGVQNNALKFSGTPEEAIYRMLTKQQGFLAPLESVDEAVQDAKVHQVAMVSGMSAAIHSVLSSFDPKKLEDTLDGGFSISKKSKYWDLYNEKYTQIAKDLERDFNDLFAEAFRQAYEDQVKKVEFGDP